MHPPIHPSIHPSIHLILSIYLSIHPSISCHGAEFFSKLGSCLQPEGTCRWSLYESSKSSPLLSNSICIILILILSFTYVYVDRVACRNQKFSMEFPSPLCALHASPISSFIIPVMLFLLIIGSVIFMKKIVSGTHSDTKFVRPEGC
jgi:hypothetical protein